MRSPSSARSFFATFSASGRPGYGPTLTRFIADSAPPLPDEMPTGYPFELSRLLSAAAAAASFVAITWMKTPPRKAWVDPEPGAGEASFGVSAGGVAGFGAEGGGGDGGVSGGGAGDVVDGSGFCSTLTGAAFPGAAAG